MYIFMNKIYLYKNGLKPQHPASIWKNVLVLCKMYYGYQFHYIHIWNTITIYLIIHQTTINDYRLLQFQNQLPNIFSQPQLNLNSTQKLGMTRKWLYTTTTTTTTHRELNVSNISSVTDKRMIIVAQLPYKRGAAWHRKNWEGSNENHTVMKLC